METQTQTRPHPLTLAAQHPVAAHPFRFPRPGEALAVQLAAPAQHPQRWWSEWMPCRVLEVSPAPPKGAAADGAVDATLDFVNCEGQHQAYATRLSGSTFQDDLLPASHYAPGPLRAPAEDPTLSQPHAQVDSPDDALLFWRFLLTDA